MDICACTLARRTGAPRRPHCPSCLEAQSVTGCPPVLLERHEVLSSSRRIQAGFPSRHDSYLVTPRSLETLARRGLVRPVT